MKNLENNSIFWSIVSFLWKNQSNWWNLKFFHIEIFGVWKTKVSFFVKQSIFSEWKVQSIICIINLSMMQIKNRELWYFPKFLLKHLLITEKIIAYRLTFIRSTSFLHLHIEQTLTLEICLKPEFLWLHSYKTSRSPLLWVTAFAQHKSYSLFIRVSLVNM